MPDEELQRVAVLAQDRAQGRVLRQAIEPLRDQGGERFYLVCAAFFEQRVASRYEKGKATYAATYFELDAVIDPAETRRWIVQGLDATANTAGRGSSGRGSGRFIDTW